MSEGTEINNLILTKDELQLIISTLINKQELLLKLRMDELQPEHDYGFLIEQLSHLINKLQRQTGDKSNKFKKETTNELSDKKIIKIPPPVDKRLVRSLTDVRLLIVDDNADFTKPMTDMLLDMGLERVDYTHNGVNAMAMIRQAKAPYHLVICDWDMPKKNGIEVLKEVREDPKLRSLPFILISGVSGGDKVRVAMELGVNDFIVKPISPDDIIKKIKQTFGIDDKAV